MKEQEQIISEMTKVALGYRAGLEYMYIYATRDSLHPEQQCQHCERIGKNAKAWLDKGDAIVDEVERTRPDGWIRCEDRLPEEDSDVLAKVAGSGVHLLNYYTDYEGNQRWSEDGNGTYTKGEVTHWRPVPEAPVEGTKGERQNK